MILLGLCVIGLMGLILLGFLVAFLSKRPCPLCDGATVRTRYFSDMGGNVREADAERDWFYCPGCGWSNRDNLTREERGQ